MHRIGRTGRAGRLGTAVTLVTSADAKAVAAIEKLIGKEIPRDSIADAPVEADAAGEEDAAPARRSRSRKSSAEPRPAREQKAEPRANREERRPRRERSDNNRRDREAPRPENQEIDDNAAVAALPPSIGRIPAPRPQRQRDLEPADHSHLPAFLLRPIRARG